jgi:predicted PurR-regulated permease PerM
MSVLISNYNNITQGVFAGFYLLLLAPILTGYMISQWKHFRKRNIEFHPDIFKFYAKRKLLSMGSDTLWDYDEYRKLKAA